MVGLALGRQRVPHREGHPEEALPGDQPVAVEALDPVPVARPHERGVEVDLLATRDERRSEVLLAPAVADVPLPRGDDLEGLVALLVEVGLPLGLDRLAVEVTRLAKRLDHGLHAH